MTELELQNIVDDVFNQVQGLDVVRGNDEYTGSADEWIRVTVQEGKGKRMTLGNDPLYRYWGVCFVQIFVKPDTGEGRSLEIVRMVTQFLRDKNISGAQFFVPSMNKVGVVNGWYQVNVLTDFYRED